MSRRARLTWREACSHVQKLKTGAERADPLRQSRLHIGLAQVFLVLFALLASFAPAVDLPVPSGGSQESREYVSAPADPRSDAASLDLAALSIAEDFEEEADDGEADKAIYLTLATLDVARDARYRVADSWPPSFRRPSAHFGTGPPIL